MRAISLFFMLGFFALLWAACGDPFTSGPEGSGGGTASECTTESDCIGSAANTCRVRRCSGGRCGFTFTVAGADCSTGVCDGEGDCVECVSADQCNGELCIENECAPAHCADGQQNMGETDLDCGGPCPGCGNGLGCTGPDDCASGVCNEGTCEPCDGNCPRPDEFCDNDGVCRPRSPNGDPCAGPEDCASGECVDEGDGFLVCCDLSCDEGCRSCAEGKTGQPNGKCAPIPDGTDPNAECPDGIDCQTGNCNGAGQCGLDVVDAACGNGVCVGDILEGGGACNKAGQCITGQNDCGLYKCDNDTCPTMCTDSSVCDIVCDGGACAACGTTPAPTQLCANLQCDMCGPNEQCQFQCNTDCGGSLNCPDGVDCAVSCAAPAGCAGLTVNCPTDHACTVLCQADGACDGVQLMCGNGPCHMECGAAMNVCDNATIHCGPNECTASCTNALSKPTLLNPQASCNGVGCP